jgi:DNA-binding NarL/FixJ family response regulator
MAKIKVDIVDDHALLRNGLLMALNYWGYTVILQAWNGKDLLDQLQADNLPNMCILDINMPVMNGYETIQALKTEWPGIKIVVYSMEIHHGDGRYSLLGANVIVSKQAFIEELKATLQYLSQHNTVLHDDTQ